MWSEVNARVMYPLRAALVQLVDIEDNTSKYCVSNLTCQMAVIGITNVVQASQVCFSSINENRFNLNSIFSLSLSLYIYIYIYMDFKSHWTIIIPFHSI